MKFKRLMTASMAAVMAVSSAIVCQISVSAAETDITSQITSGISVSELSQYTSLKVTYKPTPTADGQCGHTHTDGSIYCPWTQVPFIANSVEGMDADIDPDKKKSTWYQPDSAFTAKSGKDEKETTAEVDVADIINSFTSDKDWKDTFTLKSVTVQCWGGTLSKVVGVTGSEDTRTDAKIPDYDASPITMTKQAAQSWCPNGTAQGMIPVAIDGITTGTTTYGEISRAVGPGAPAQAVGQAVGRNKVSIMIPCHRVIGADGSLTGYAGGVERKQFLLDLEEPEEVREARLF